MQTYLDTTYNVKTIFSLLLNWFDVPKVNNQTDLRQKQAEKISNKPEQKQSLRTWWPRYTDGDFRFELCIGALLVHQVSWYQVRTCIQNLNEFLHAEGQSFNEQAILKIPLQKLNILIKSSRFPIQKSLRIRTFCQFLLDYGGINTVFRNQQPETLKKVLQNLKAGFGPETCDTVMLYAGNHPVFITDTYARTLLHMLDLANSNNYYICQKIYQNLIKRDFTNQDLETIQQQYSSQELAYVLPNNPKTEHIPIILLYQQFHAGIVELGISKRWTNFKDKLKS